LQISTKARRDILILNPVNTIAANVGIDASTADQRVASVPAIEDIVAGQSVYYII
jgi:hypothetical protein